MNWSRARTIVTTSTCSVLILWVEACEATLIYLLSAPPTPTVYLDVIALVASSCRYNRGVIEPRVAHECTVHAAAQRGLAERPQHCHPPRAQPVAPVWQPHGRRPRLPLVGRTDQAPPREQSASGGRTRAEPRHHRSTVPCDARPTRLAYFRLRVLASLHSILLGSSCSNSTREAS